MPKRLTTIEREWRTLPEKQVQNEFMAEARKKGWMVFHVGDSRKMVRRGKYFVPVADPDIKGFPDLVLVHPRWGVVYIEVKKELGKLEPAQEVVRNALLAAGQKWFLLKPSTRDRLVEGLDGGFEAT